MHMHVDCKVGRNARLGLPRVAQLAEDLQLGDVIADGVDRLPLNLRQVREEAERGAIVRALYLAGDNISEASELLGVTRPTLYSIMEKYNLRN